MPTRFIVPALVSICAFLATSIFAADRPNVLFISVDDMNDWVGCLEGYSGTAHTPHIDELAARGVNFTNAHCASPLCCPSRTAVMTGLMPSSTGIYRNSHWWKPNHPDLITIPLHFLRNGYEVYGAGKIFHHTAGNNPPSQWNTYHRLVFSDDPWFRGNRLNYPWTTPQPNPTGFPFSNVTGLPHENDWGALRIQEADYDDARTVDFAIDFLNQPHTKPFFLACGLFRPHLPWYVPQRYLELYPLEEIQLPICPADDLEDVPDQGRIFAKARRGDMKIIKREGKYRHAVQAYLASISFADAQIGRLLKALEVSEKLKETIVVLWSDHGWHLGEKQHWHKSTLWSEATRVPFIIAAPDIESASCPRPVSLINIFPTLIEMCGLPKIESHDGTSLVPLLRDPAHSWTRPAITEYLRGNASVRSERYRYIRYHDGGEELYDMKSDPHEWKNIAKDPDYNSVKTSLVKAMPETWADAALTKEAFDFDPDTFVWTHKTTSRVTSGTQ